MNSDRNGVGGFFEDLPVLIFVLLGVFVLVSASVFSTRVVSSGEDAERTNRAAESILIGILSALSHPESHGHMTTLAALRQYKPNLSVPATESLHGYCVSLVSLHPTVEWLYTQLYGFNCSAESTGFARAAFNAICDDGLIAVVEARVLAW